MTTPRARRFVPLAAVVVLLALVLVGAVVRARNTSTGFSDLAGVRLGMTVRDVRARFDALGRGEWESRVDKDVILTWKPSDTTRGGPLAATFEFHLGILMAIRAELPPGDRAAKGPPFELTDAAVVVRERAPSSAIKLTAIARSCPLHAEESARLVQAVQAHQGQAPTSATTN